MNRYSEKHPALSATRRAAWHRLAMPVVGPVSLTILLVSCAFFLVFLPSYKSHLLQSRRDMTRELTNTVWMLVDDYARRSSTGELSTEEAQQRAILRIRQLRYGPESKDYFWITDIHQRMVMHPNRPELDGENLSTFKDIHGKFFFREFVEIARISGEGFVTYYWQWNDNPQRIEPKESYVKLFQPWGWIIGTGLYTEDVTNKINQMTRSLVYAFLAIFLIILILSGMIVLRSIRVERERVEAVANLHTSERQMAAIIDSLPDATLVVDQEGKILAWNKAMEKMTKKSAFEMIGKGEYEYALPFHGKRCPILCDLLLHPNPEREKAYQLINRTESEISGELFLPAFSSGGTHLHATASLLHDDAGQISGVIESIRDVTIIYRAQAAMRESEENLRITLEAIGDAVIACDAAGRITRINRMACMLTGWTPTEARGRFMNDVLMVFTQDEAGVRHPIPSMPDSILAHNRNEPLSENTVLLSRDGTERLISDSCAPILDEAGHTVGAVIVFRDVTDHRSMEEELRQKRKMEAIGQLAGGVAHDFNNLLGGIIGATELLQRRLKNDAESTKLLSMILTTASRAGDLTSKLLAFSRKGRLLSIPINTHAIVSDVLSILKHTVDPRVFIQSDLQAKSTMVMGDPSLLQNALLNLCLNARDAMLDGGTLTLQTEDVTLTTEYHTRYSQVAPPGDYLRITVKDTGTGIPTHLLDRIFEPFFTTKPVSSGTGLGLSAVFGTVQSHKGIIEVSSKAGEGCTFTILLPAILTAPTNETQDSKDFPKRQGGILVVDDDLVIRDTIVLYLKECGFTVWASADGATCRELFQQHQDHIDVVMLDVVMPRENGVETFDALRAIDPKVKVMIMTGFPNQASCETLREKGLKGFVKKPFTQPALLAAIDKIMSGDEAF